MPSKEHLDAFELGRIEKEKRKERIARALDGPSLGKEREYKHRVAEWLYHARYDGWRYDETPTDREILDRFCERIFHGASFDEVLEAWDRFLG